MTTNINRIADQINPRDAQLAIARIMKVTGQQAEWDSETIELVMSHVQYITPDTILVAGERFDWPSYTDSVDGTVEFWQGVGW
ncbi:hypothetical protein BH762_gp030 [Gordonia phage OneUp]|uniref:Uncharacterized protein n=1 Tax=Gordonia phage OneUp TaxID=1838074 RepID=A0A160DF13_9CAUD|nr:hypothetical protein BH762_gp030 [Gordonia phage OneUp]ANA86488.1 hypothetical protein PBI_ONEUP_155 [Gordonia phage OneUp]